MLSVETDRTLVALYRKVSKGAAALSVLVGFLVLAGWALDIESLKRLLPGLVTMKANTAVAFMLAGISLWLWDSRAHPVRRYVANGAAVLTSLIGILTLLEYLFGLKLGIDELLFQDAPGAIGTFSPGRMAGNTAVGFLLLGAAMLLRDDARRSAAAAWAAQALSGLTGLIALLALIGYAYDVSTFVGLGYHAEMALHTAITFVFLSIGILLSMPDRGLMSTVASQGFGGLLMRRLLPVMVAAQLVLGWAILEGMRGGLYDRSLAMSLMVISGIVIFGVLVWTTATSMDRIDAERRRTRAALGQSEARFHAAVEGSFDAFFILDSIRDEAGEITDFRFMDMNARGEAMIGMKRNEAIGGGLCELLPANRTDGFFDKYVGVVETREPLIEEFRVSDPQIAAGWIHHQVIPLGDGISITSRDITDQKQAEEEKTRLTQYLQLLLASTDEGLYGIDPNGNCTFINQSACRMLGYSEQEVVGKNMHELAHYSHADGSPYPIAGCPIYRAVHGETGGRVDNEVFWRRDGTPIPVEYSSYPILEEGVLRGAVVTFSDITERKQAEKALRDSEERLRRLSEATFEGIIIHEGARPLEANEAVSAMFGYTQEELLSMESALVLVAPEHRQQVREHISTGWGEPYESVGLRKDGTTFVMEIHARMMPYNGRVARMMPYNGRVARVAAIRDITQRKRTEDEIRKLNADLIQRATDLTSINRELEAFSYSVSHDLRAPLRSIDGFSQALLEDYSDSLDEEGLDYLRRVRAASQRMGQLIDDMLGLSRVTRGEMKREMVDLSAVVTEIVHDLRVRDPDRRAEVLIEAGLLVEGDARLLRVALDNLLRNAWKFTSRELDARIEFGASKKDGELVYFVKDNGAGFDMAYAGKLFGAFQRLHGQEEYSGTGIGLATVQRIIHRHGGRIWAESEVGKGASFYFTLE